MGREGRRQGAGRKRSQLKRFVIRSADMARLSPVEIQFLRSIASKLSNAAPDASGNQKESKPAMEAEVVDS